MSLPRDINRGDVISANWLNAVKNEVLRSIVGDGKILVNRTGQNVTVGLGVRIPGVPVRFLARITATSAMGDSDSKFIYDIEEVIPDITMSDGTITDTAVTLKTNGRTGKAINLAEIANEDETGIAFGTDRSAPDYSATGFAPRPISGAGEDNTHKIDQLVWIIGKQVVMEGEGSEATRHTVFFFDRQGVHDGPCEEA